MTAAAVMMQVVSQLDSPEMGNDSSDGSASPPHSGAQQAELQLAAAWQVSLLILCPATLTALCLLCDRPPPQTSCLHMRLAGQPASPVPCNSYSPGSAVQQPSSPCNRPLCLHVRCCALGVHPLVHVLSALGRQSRSCLLNPVMHEACKGIW